MSHALGKIPRWKAHSPQQLGRCGPFFCPIRWYVHLLPQSLGNVLKFEVSTKSLSTYPIKMQTTPNVRRTFSKEIFLEKNGEKKSFLGFWVWKCFRRYFFDNKVLPSYHLKTSVLCIYLFLFFLIKKRTSLIAFHKSNLPIMLKTLYFFMLFVQQASLRKFRLFSPDLFINLGRKYFALRGWECLAEVGRLSKKKSG